ncbi:MAG: hypothetical protein JOY77_02555 [Alphaproteobacteria bacterium]|nr:hypothetical protein [Alphaproteobacteria bacterium]
MAAFDRHRVGYRPHQNSANAVDAERLPPAMPPPLELLARMRVPLERDALFVEPRAVNESADHDAHGAVADEVEISVSGVFPAG